MSHPLIQAIQNGANPTLDQFVDAFGSIFELLHALKTTSQDEQWHQEGNVHIHTEMVLDQTYQLLANEAGHLNAEHRLILILAALLHDIGKPLTTKEVERDGRHRTISPAHEIAGASYLFYRILDLGLSSSTTQAILTLVAYHNQPKLLVVKNRGREAYYRLARLTNLELIYYLERADMAGRISPSQSTDLENLELFRLTCEEYGLWNNADPYSEWRTIIRSELADKGEDAHHYTACCAIRDFENGEIQSPYEAIGRSYGHLDSHPQLVIMSGLSGSGKSRWIHENLPNHVIVSLDDLRAQLAKNRSDQSINPLIVREAKALLKSHLGKGKKVVWDATNIRKDFRSLLTRIGFDYHALVTIIVFHKPLKEIVSSNEKRQYPVSKAVLMDQLNRYQFVEQTEAHQIIFR